MFQEPFQNGDESMVRIRGGMTRGDESAGKNIMTIDFEGIAAQSVIDEKAFKALVRAAIALNHT